MTPINSSHSNNSGFTLLEVVMAVFIFAMLAVGIIALVSGLISNSNKQQNLLADVDQARKVSYGIINELRNSNISNTGAFSIDTAGNQTLIFYTSLNGTNIMSRIRYYVTGTTLYRGVVTPTGSPLTYNLASEVVSPVLQDIANGATPLFYYYDGTYNSTTSNTPLTQPVNLNSIRLIKVNLMVYNKAGTTGTNTFTITAQTTLRNLKSNLGS